MKEIACAILCIGLCINNSYMKSKGLDVDLLESLFAIIAALIVVF